MKTRAAAVRPANPLAIVLAAALLVVFGVFLASPARAHDTLIGSEPSNGEVLSAPLSQFDLEFSAELLPATAKFMLKDASGEVVWEGEPAIQARHARAPFPEIHDGAYSLAWSVVSSDGHRIEGLIPFELSAGIAAPDSGAAAPPDATVDPEPTSSDEAAPSPISESPESATDTANSGNILEAVPLWAKILIAVAAIGGVAILLLRGRGTDKSAKKDPGA